MTTALKVVFDAMLSIALDSHSMLYASRVLALRERLNWKVDYGYECETESMLKLKIQIIYFCLNFVLYGVHFSGNQIKMVMWTGTNQVWTNQNWDNFDVNLFL